MQDQKKERFGRVLVASSSVSHVLNYILPNVNRLLEDNIITITESFTKIAENNVKLDKLLSENDIDSAKSIATDISRNVSSAIIGLQFQDRVTQNLQIATKLSKILSEKVEDRISELGSPEADTEVLRQIYEEIFLGEIRDEFLNYLEKKDYIESKREIIGDESKEPKVSNEDIELF